jgi:hypothetical protein
MEPQYLRHKISLIQKYLTTKDTKNTKRIIRHEEREGGHEAHEGGHGKTEKYCVGGGFWEWD